MTVSPEQQAVRERLHRHDPDADWQVFNLLPDYTQDDCCMLCHYWGAGSEFIQFVGAYTNQGQQIQGPSMVCRDADACEYRLAVRT